MKLWISAMIGENLEPEKPLITETNLQQNQTDRDYQLWQEVCDFELRGKSTLSCRFILVLGQWDKNPSHLRESHYPLAKVTDSYKNRRNGAISDIHSMGNQLIRKEGGKGWSAFKWKAVAAAHSLTTLRARFIRTIFDHH